jgi:hypothetical protein
MINDWGRRWGENTATGRGVTEIVRRGEKTSLAGVVRSDEQGEQRKDNGESDHGGFGKSLIVNRKSLMAALSSV